MAPGADTDSALRAWAAVHARSVGRSGAGPASRTAGHYRLTHTVYAGGETEVTWSSHRGQPRLVARGGRTLISDQTGSFSRVATSEGVWRLDIPHIRNIQILRSWHERNLVTMESAYHLPAWQIVDPATGGLVEMGDTIVSIAWWRDPASGLLAYGTADGKIHVDGVDFLHTYLGYEPGEDPARWLGWLPAAEAPRLVRAGRKGAIDVRDVRFSRWRRVGYEPDLSAFACSPDPRRARLAVGCSNGEIRIYDIDESRAAPQTLYVPECVVRSLAWSSDPERPLLAAGMSDGTARLWDPDTGRCVAEVEHPAAVTSVALTVDGSGRSLLATGCADGQARIWIADDPAKKNAGRAAASIEADAQFTVTNSTPQYLSGESAAWMSVPEGRLLTAERIAPGYRFRAWDSDTDQPDDFLTISDRVYSLAMACSPTADPTFAASTSLPGSMTVGVWSLNRRTVQHEAQFVLPIPADGTAREVQLVMSGQPSQALAVVWIPGRTAESGAGAESYIDVFDLRRKQAVFHQRLTWAVGAAAWSSRISEKPLLAVGDESGRVLILNPLDDTAPHREFHVQGPVTSICWCAADDVDEPMLAVATGAPKGPVHICEPTTGAVIRTLQHSGRVVSMVSWDGGGRPGSKALVTLSTAGILRVWEPSTGELVNIHDSRMPAVCRPSFQPAWLHLRDRLRLAVRTVGGLRVYDIKSSPPATTPREAVPEPRLIPPLSVSQGFLALGAGGLWAPLGLVADALTVVGGTRERLYDAQLEALSGHPGVARLRSLKWPARARVGLAALLVAGQASVEQNAPEHAAPPQTTPAEQLRALLRALETEPAEPTAAPSALRSLTEAADAVTDKTLTLLRILGSEAVAADPLLAVRLAGRVAELPELPPRQTALLEGGRALRSLDDADRASDPRFTPGTVGISRHGPLHTALPTQLALPDQLRMIRYARGELLHRTHPAHRPPPTRPVTVILDTTPATYGRCEIVLRLAAHLITVALWRAGRSPSLVTLTDPDLVRELSRPEDLLTVWTSRTLTPPDFPRALNAAAQTANDVVIILTNSHAVRDQLATGRIVLGPRHHLLTAHTPTSAPPAPPAHPNHRQVSTTVGFDRLTAHLFAMLAQDAETYGAVR